MSPDEDDDLDFEETESDIDTIWKVIKFVAALKRNSKKRRNWVSLQVLKFYVINAIRRLILLIPDS